MRHVEAPLREVSDGRFDSSTIAAVGASAVAEAMCADVVAARRLQRWIPPSRCFLRSPTTRPLRPPFRLRLRSQIEMMQCRRSFAHSATCEERKPRCLRLGVSLSRSISVQTTIACAATQSRSDCDRLRAKSNGRSTSPISLPLMPLSRGPARTRRSHCHWPAAPRRVAPRDLTGSAQRGVEGGARSGACSSLGSLGVAEASCSGDRLRRSEHPRRSPCPSAHGQ